MRKVRNIALVVMLALFAVPLFAATSYTINLSGSVSPTCSLTVTTAAAASSLAITTKVTSQTIATVVERSNASTGYTVSLESATGWLLQGTTANLPYTLAYGGAAVNTGVAAGVPTNITTSATTTPSAGLTKTLAISFDGSLSMLPSGDYTDTLTITIAAL
jgi:hypothetical protein